MPAAWVSAGTALLGATGAFGGSSNPNVGYSPLEGNNAQSAWALTGGLNDPFTSLQPQYMQLMQQQMNNPYSGMYQTGANQAGGMLVNAGNTAYGAGTNLYGGANTELGAANTALTTAFDPNQVLYNKYLSDTQNQSAAANAMSGVSNSPYGGGVTGQNLANFNIGWDQNQLGNQLAGLQAYNSALSGVGTQYNNAAGLQSGGAAAVAQGYQLPYTAANTLTGNNINALNTYMGANQMGNNMMNQQIQDYLQGAGLGQSQNQLALQAQQDALQNQQNATAGWTGLALQGLNAYQNYNNPNYNWGGTPSSSNFTGAPYG
jgi:hypothetical protein